MKQLTRKALTSMLAAFCFAAVNSILGAPGDVDTTFGDGGFSLIHVKTVDHYNGPSTILTQPDGKILVCGQIDFYGDDNQFFLARFYSSGEFDPTFGYQGMIIGSYGDPYVGADMVLQPDGRIIVVGNHGDHVSIQRFKSDGDFDFSFGEGGTATLEIEGLAVSVVLQPDGKIVAAISHWERPPGIVRLNSDGSLDQGFGEGGMMMPDKDEITWIGKIFVQPDGKLLAIGSHLETNPGPRGVTILRRLADGTRDRSFGSDGRVLHSTLTVEGPTDAAIQPDGKIVVASRGSSGDYGAPLHYRLTRYNVDGSVDAGYTDGSSLTGGPWKLAIQQDGKVILAGSDLTAPNVFRSSLTRLDHTGLPDTDFGINGKSFPGSGGSASDVWIQRDGKILVLGASGGYLRYDFWITRSLGNPTVPVSGKVTTPAGAGLRNATVTLKDGAGNTRTVLTSSLGFYSFDDIPAGSTVTIAAMSRRYRFQPITRTAHSELSDVDLIGIE